MTETSFEQAHPRSDTGRFTEKAAADPGTAVLTASPLPQPARTEADVAAMTEHRGWFVNGYDPSDINDFVHAFEDAQFACVWSGNDDWSPCGDSELVGRVGEGPWRPLSTQLYTFLFEPDSADMDVPDVWLSDEPLDENPDDLWTDMGGNYAPDLAEVCRACNAPLDDGEGSDGYCGNCADQRSCAECGEHIADDLADVPDDNVCRSCRDNT